MKRFFVRVSFVVTMLIFPVLGMATPVNHCNGMIKQYTPSEEIVITDSSGKEKTFILSEATSYSGNLKKGMYVHVTAHGSMADDIQNAVPEKSWSTDSIPKELYPKLEPGTD